MKITIESTNSEPTYSNKVTIEREYDDINMREISEMLRGLLISYGFAESSVDQYILCEMNNFGENNGE